MRSVAVTLAVLALVGCSRDPNVTKKRYLENGNKYFSKGKYKEASIMYRNAVQKDMRYGPAYYRLALAELKLSRIPQSVGALRRAIELIPADQPERTEAMVKLADIYVAMSREKQFLDEVDTISKDLLKKNPNSFDGHRLTGDLALVQAQESVKTGDRERSKERLSTAIAEYRRAAAINPGQPAVTNSLARTLAADRQFAEAEKLYKELLAHDKTYFVAYTELYELYLYQNKANEAENVLKTAIAENPKQYGFLTLLAAHYHRMKRRDDVVRVVNQIKSHAKEFEQAYLMAGDFYLRLGEADEAVKQYREGIAADAKQKVAYQKRIIEVLMRQGKRGEAADVNSALLKQNPKDNDARALEASLMLDRGDVQKAIAELQAVVTVAPDNFVARYNLGRAHVERREWEQARQQFIESIRLRPDYIPPRQALAQLQVARGEFDAALKSLGEILRIDPNNAKARLIASAALMGLKRFDDARRLLQSMLQANAGSPDVVFQMGVVDLADKKFREAEDAFRKSYQLNPANAQGLMGVVELYMTQNKPEQALAALQAEVAKSPTRQDIRLALANTAVRAGKFDLAISEFQKVVAGLDKGSTRLAGETWMRLGETYRRKNDVNNSIMALQKAQEFLPEDPKVLGTLGLALEGAGRKVEARQAYEQTLKADSNSPVALNNLAFLMADTGGDLNQALTYAQRAKQLLPNMYEVSDTLGWIYLKKNLTDNAIEIFRDLVAKQPDQATYRYHLGLAFSQKGDRSKALKELQQALKEHPSHQEEGKIKELLAKLG